MTQALDALTAKLLDRCQSGRRRPQPTLWPTRTSLSVEVRGGKLEKPSGEGSTGNRVAVFVGQRSANRLFLRTTSSAHRCLKWPYAPWRWHVKHPKNNLNAGLADPDQIRQQDWDVPQTLELRCPHTT